MAETYELGQGTGPLKGVKVVEIAGIGPGPHACMILADLGADVIRVERPGGQALAGGGSHMLINRGRPSVALDLKTPDAISTVKRLVEDADVVVEGMRPGVMERLGLGPDDLRALNERLVYARMTGWGQHGPLAQAAGHDMNYIAITGTLFGLGQDKERPHFPTNLVGDFGGGSTYLVIGVLAALLEAKVSGKGQVVDAAIVDGTAHLNAMTAAFLASGGYREERAANLLDGGVAYYDVYETADGRHMSVGALEPQFYDAFVELLGIVDSAPDRYDPGNNDKLRALIADAFLQRTQREWIEVFEGTDACVAGIIPITEAFEHPHLKARGTFVEKDGHVQPAPAPRFSRTEATIGRVAESAGDSTRAALAAWGIDDVDALIESGAAVQA
ncbi:CaiB/BaiF CoA-transferase family protein [Nocardioides sp. YIM 152315]|uniref:CaiB/BaiF CoA transferase family protein n=1 Tax=Nocardioides sp. YIM 152315 TaxID=3031760 RepID=UPI0023D9B0DF|nr:CaiB/BaiF CoA-transferase family protein [Nocardioides sp. YIM 152315]MDF1604348.1 CaiB/BaiF CoA-transferase family protein [Nocardioides sp. YIM 152315]